MKCCALLGIGAATLAVGGAASIELTIDASLKDAGGVPLYVSDATVRAQIPWLNGVGARLSTCMQGAMPVEQFHIRYTPKVTGPHRATASILTCEHPKGSSTMHCEEPTAKLAVVFDIDPNKYFQIGSDVPITEALEIARALKRGQMRKVDGSIDDTLRTVDISGISRHGDGYLVGYGDCGCYGSIDLLRAGTAKAPSFAITESGMMCI